MVVKSRVGLQGKKNGKTVWDSAFVVLGGQRVYFWVDCEETITLGVERG